MWRKYGIGLFWSKPIRHIGNSSQSRSACRQKLDLTSKYETQLIVVNLALGRVFAAITGLVVSAGICAAAYALPLSASEDARGTQGGPGAPPMEAAASKTYCTLMLALHFPQTGCQSLVAAPAQPKTPKTATAGNGVSGSSSGPEAGEGAAKAPAQTLLGIIPFMNNSSVLTTNVTATLDKLSGDLGKMPGTKLVIQGHANRTGSEEYSRELSRQRAEAVAKYLGSKLRGFDPKNVLVEPRGTMSPLPAFDPADGNQRRVEIYRTR
jgi:outer membrane protein OmpA-like peptidoglycan-associated protein